MKTPIHRKSICFLLASLVLAFVGFTTSAADPAPEMRYRWKAGETHTYSVRIEADYGDYLEILSGNPTYQVEGADQDGIKLSFRGGLVEKSQLKPDKKGILMPRPRGPFSPFTGVGSGRGVDLTINDRGEVVSSKGSSQLPYLLGNLSQLMLEPLSKDAAKTWKISNPLSIVQSESGLPHPLSRTDDRKQIKATLEISYTIDKEDDKAVMLTRKVEMKTAETIGGKPRIEIEGEGKLTFDRKLGCFSKLEAQQKIIQREANKTQETPLKISYRLLDESERKELAKTADGALLFPSEALTEALQKQALDDLKSGDKLRLFKGLNLLQTKSPPPSDKEPDQLRKDIAKAVEDVLNGPEKTMRFSASKALVKWATKESVPTLIKAVQGDDFLTRHFAMDALAQLKAEEGVEPIAKRLTEAQDRLRARKALEAMGPKAEPEVLKLANNNEWMVRNEVCQILQTIGTAKSVPALTAMQQSDANPLVKRQAKVALEAIEKRK